MYTYSVYKKLLHIRVLMVVAGKALVVYLFQKEEVVFAAHIKKCSTLPRPILFISSILLPTYVRTT